MFMITKSWIMVPQFLYYIFLFGGGLLIFISAGMMVRGIVKRKEKQYFLCQSMILIVAVLIFATTISGKIVGHMMVGSESTEGGRLSDEELCRLAAAYYGRHNDGFIPEIIEISDVNDDGQIVIHLYEDMGDHTATYDWYTVNPVTGIGEDFLFNEINLLEGETE